MDAVLNGGTIEDGLEQLRAERERRPPREVRGRIFCRRVAESHPAVLPGHRLVMLSSVMIVPDDAPEFADGAMTDYKGFLTYKTLGEGAPFPHLHLVGWTTTDMREETRGESMGSLFTQPIWRF